MQRLTDTQRVGLRKLYRQAEGAERVLRPERAWLGAMEGVEGTTLLALERRGLVITREVRKPHRRSDHRGRYQARSRGRSDVTRNSLQGS